jgi:hypothetical protein
MKTKYKYIHFVEGGTFNDKPQYLCRNNKSNSILALIFYYKPWKQYCFSQYEQNTVFNDGCLKKSFKTKEDALKMYLENLDENQPYIFTTKGDD